MSRRTRWLLSLVVLALLVAGSQAQETKKKKKKKAGPEYIELFEHKNETWQAFRDDKSGRVFYTNVATRESTWNDPRKDPSAVGTMAILAFSLPFVLLLAAGGGYLWYIKTYFPEKLKPKKKKSGKVSGRSVSPSTGRRESPPRSRKEATEATADAGTKSD